jgi:hypothetical protein
MGWNVFARPSWGRHRARSREFTHMKSCQIRCQASRVSVTVCAMVRYAGSSTAGPTSRSMRIVVRPVVTASLPLTVPRVGHRR